MQGCVQHFCLFRYFLQTFSIPGCINAIQLFYSTHLQTLFESKPFVGLQPLPVKNAVAALRRARQPRNINLISADDAQSKAERISNRPTQKEKGLLRKTRSSPFKIHSWGIMASNQPISSAAICSSRVSGCHAGCAGSGGSACSGAQRLSSVSGAGCSGAASHCGTASGAVSGCAGVSGAVCCMAARAASALRQAASAFSARALACSSCSHACSQAASSSALSCLRASRVRSKANIRV